MRNNNNLKIIGLSATPLLKYPFDNILTKYSIYDAYKDNIIVNPKIMWITNEKEINNLELLQVLKKEINKLYYKNNNLVWND